MPTPVGNKRKDVYYTPAEWDVILEKSKSVNMRPGTYIQQISLNGTITYYDFPKISELIMEMNKIGVNVNQIAHKVNQIETIYNVDVEQLQEGYEELCRMLNQYLSTIRQNQQ